MKRWFWCCGGAAVFGLLTRPAAANVEDGATPSSRSAPPAWLDVEVDPFAYLFSGYSVHVGVRVRQLRFDLGAFAAKYPPFLAPNPALDGRAGGAGLKLDWRFAQQAAVSEDWATELSRGPFVGVGLSYARLVVTDPDSRQSAAQLQLHASVRAGWDIPVAGGFYLAPWASVGPVLGAEPLVVAGQRWAPSEISIFATVHVGWRPPWL